MTNSLFLCLKQQSFQEGYEGIGKPRNRNGIESFEEVPMSVALLTYMGWGIIILIGYVKEFLLSFVPSQNPEKNREVLLFIFLKLYYVCLCNHFPH